jgi:hypothetical protein
MPRNNIRGLPTLKDLGITECNESEVVTLSCWNDIDNFTERFTEIVHRLILLENPKCRIVSIDTVYTNNADADVLLLAASLSSLGLMVTGTRIPQARARVNLQNVTGRCGHIGEARYNIQLLMGGEPLPTTD